MGLRPGWGLSPDYRLGVVFVGDIGPRVVIDSWLPDKPQERVISMLPPSPDVTAKPTIALPSANFDKR